MPDDLEGVADAVTGVREVAEGEVVCAEGDKADRWWIVADGMADVTVRGLYVATIGPGESIGELALLDGEPRGATVTATTAMVLHEVDGDQFVDALLASPRLAVAMLREVARRLQEREPTAGPGDGHRTRRRPQQRSRRPRRTADPARPVGARLLRRPGRAARRSAGAGAGALVQGAPVLRRDPVRGRPPHCAATERCSGPSPPLIRRTCRSASAGRR